MNEMSVYQNILYKRFKFQKICFQMFRVRIQEAGGDGGDACFEVLF